MPRAAILAVCCLLVVGIAHAQQPPTNAQVATILVGEVHALVMDLAAQRDAIGGGREA